MSTRGKTWRRLWDQEALKTLILQRALQTNSGCWRLVNHGLDSYLYIRIDRRKVGVHTVAAWAWHGGPIPKGRNTITMHTCDRPGCVNPEHVRRAPQQANVFDAIAKGRRPSRLTAQARTLLPHDRAG